MISKGHVIDAYRRIRTTEAVTKAYDECKDVLRHNRKDNMGMQEAAAPLMVRLGKDQEAYDYIKWWDTAYTKPDYDWNDMTLPYLDIHNTDEFEPLTAFGMDNDCECECVPNTGLSHLVTLMLIKLRLTLDLTECGRFITSTSSAERRSDAKLQALFTSLSSRIIPDHPELVKAIKQGRFDAITKYMCILARQLVRLYAAISYRNKHIWHAFVEQPERYWATSPDMTAGGSEQEASLVVQHCYQSWVESKGVMEWLTKNKRKFDINSPLPKV